jgi:hypothetical protein
MHLAASDNYGELAISQQQLWTLHHKIFRRNNSVHMCNTYFKGGFFQNRICVSYQRLSLRQINSHKSNLEWRYLLYNSKIYHHDIKVGSQHFFWNSDQRVLWVVKWLNIQQLITVCGNWNYFRRLFLTDKLMWKWQFETIVCLGRLALLGLTLDLDHGSSTFIWNVSDFYRATRRHIPEYSAVNRGLYMNKTNLT